MQSETYYYSDLGKIGQKRTTDAEELNQKNRKNPIIGELSLMEVFLIAE